MKANTTQAAGCLSRLTAELEAWQPMQTAPKDRQILIKWGDAILEATWLKHRNAFCYHSNDYHLHSESAFSELEYDWLDGWQEASCEKIGAIFKMTGRDI